MTISEMLDCEIVDHGVVDAFHMWFAYGLEPGSFATHCLIGDFEAACASAHPALSGNNYESVWVLISYANFFPHHIRKDFHTIKEWSRHEGLVQASASDKTLARLEWNEELFGAWPDHPTSFFKRTGSN